MSSLLSFRHQQSELARRAERAEAEVAALRLMVRSLALALDAVPGKPGADIRLVEEAKNLAGVSVE
jgi:hypothetical protein